jgi:hypothetical protein
LLRRGLAPTQRLRSGAAAAKTSVSLGQLVRRYLEEREPNWRPRYYAEVKRQLEKYWKPLHGLGIEAITRQTVVDGIAAAQGEVAADRARTALSGIFSWAWGDYVKRLATDRLQASNVLELRALSLTLLATSSA